MTAARGPLLPPRARVTRAELTLHLATLEGTSDGDSTI
jgi:hypothetical protein